MTLYIQVTQKLLIGKLDYSHRKRLDVADYAAFTVAVQYTFTWALYNVSKYKKIRAMQYKETTQNNYDSIRSLKKKSLL